MRGSVALGANIGEFVAGSAGVLNTIAHLLAFGALDKRLIAVDGEVVHLVTIAIVLIRGGQLIQIV